MRGVREHPIKRAALFQYLDIIYKAYSYFSGSSWVQYDEEFRLHSAINSALSWDQVHSAFWFQIMTGTRALAGDRSHSGHMVQYTVIASLNPLPLGGAVG